MVAAGRYARNAVLTVFEQIGGTARLAQEADEDPKWFYEKLFSKTITREIEDRKVEASIEDLLLDAATIVDTTATEVPPPEKTPSRRAVIAADLEDDEDDDGE